MIEIIYNLEYYYIFVPFCHERYAWKEVLKKLIFYVLCC
jgi:hypothetical protein